MLESIPQHHLDSNLKPSSDTWVAHEGFSCLDLNGTAVPASTCDFGPVQFDPADSPTFQLFPNVSFFVQYDSGEFLSGPAGFDTVAVGPLSVSQQEIGTYYIGDTCSNIYIQLIARVL